MPSPTWHVTNSEMERIANCADSKVKFVVIRVTLSAFAKGLCSVPQIARQLLGNFTDRSKIGARSATKHYHPAWSGKLA